LVYQAFGPAAHLEGAIGHGGDLLVFVLSAGGLDAEGAAAGLEGGGEVDTVLGDLALGVLV
jgi:hypothetical protein